MSLLGSIIGTILKGLMSAVNRSMSPKDIVVDLSMNPDLYVAKNLAKQNLRYHFSRRDQLISRQREGWRIAVGRRGLIFTERYVDKRSELVLMCRNL